MPPPREPGPPERERRRASWHSASPYLDQALDLTPAERGPWLAALRAEQPEIAADVDDWLAQCDALELEAFLDDHAEVPADDQPLAGVRLGAYRLVRPVGHGGMGSVWLAERADGRFDARVAVKLLNPALLGRAGEARFLREGRILARLTHPHIARLADAGVSAIGQPYLVLEYVEGEPIDAHCDQRRLDVDGRLRLFLDVCAAVAHAHAVLVVHRDLKPSNVLVGTDGRVKVLDFGIARLLESDQGEIAVTVTQTGETPLTPAYAAPEQLLRSDVNVATDVFALGTLLHELLTGRHPFEQLLDQPLVLPQAIVGEDPPRLSAHVRDRAPARRGDATAIAAARGTTPARLAAALRGDLDAIVTTALRKDPAQRYASVDALALDVRRHLDHEPITARAVSARDRLSKFVRRHRASVAAAALLAAAIGAGLVGTISQAQRAELESRRARQEADAARAERDRARFQARRAQASSEFMRNLVTQIGATPLSMKQVLDRGRIALQQQYGGDRAFVARMLMQLSGPYIELGDDATSGQMMDQAMTIARELDDPELLVATNCGRAYDMVAVRNADAARRYLADAALHAKRLPTGGPSGECARSESRLAMLDQRFDDAITHARRAVESLEAEGETENTRYTSALNDLAIAFYSAGRLHESLAAQERVTADSRRIGRGRTISVVVSLQNTGNVLRLLGRFLDSDRIFDEAEALSAGISSDGRMQPYMLVNHGRLLALLGRDEDARARWARARSQGGLPPNLTGLLALGEATLLAQRGDAGAARRLLSSIATAGGSALGGASAAGVRQLEAWIAHAEGRTLEARTILDALAAEQGRVVPPPAALAEILELSARFSGMLGDHTGAVERSTAALRAATASIGEARNAITGRVLLTRGEALAAAGEPAAARSALDQAIAHLTVGAGADHAWTAQARAARTAL
jgi:serine/threonine-protein kinase